MAAWEPAWVIGCGAADDTRSTTTCIKRSATSHAASTALPQDCEALSAWAGACLVEIHCFAVPPLRIVRIDPRDQAHGQRGAGRRLRGCADSRAWQAHAASQGHCEADDAPAPDVLCWRQLRTSSAASAPQMLASTWSTAPALSAGLNATKLRVREQLGRHAIDATAKRCGRAAGWRATNRHSPPKTASAAGAATDEPHRDQQASFRERM